MLNFVSWGLSNAIILGLFPLMGDISSPAPLSMSATNEYPLNNLSKGAIFAHAVIEPKSKSQVKGNVYFTQLKDGVLVVAEIENLKQGQHGFHVHEFGDCSAPDASSAGGHFNPLSKKHGGPDDSERHVGDLGNITADSNGYGYYMRIDKEISLNGPNSIIGHSIVVHEKPDDFVSQPAGNSGARQGCGKITEVVID